MDNMTHSLIGITLGRTWTRFSSRASRLARPVIAASILGSNFPDLDLVVSPKFHSKLGYLLNHRGITHSFIMTPVLAVFAALASLAFAEREDRRKRPVFAFLFGVAWIGLLLHIVADSWNDYGVHPFWPFVNRWYYGDFIFILEPLIWAAILPLAIFETASKFWKGFFLLAGVGLLATIWISSYASVLTACVVSAWIALLFLAARFWGNLPVAWAGILIVLAGFGAASHHVRSQAVSLFGSASDGREKLVQLALTPGPANPFCWKVVAVSAAGEEMYRVRIGAYSYAPSWYPPETCIPGVSGEKTAPLAASTLAGSFNLHWMGEFQGDLRDLQALVREHCQVSSFLKFARAPFWLPTKEGWVIGDLRYDRERGLGFAEIGLSGMSKSEAQECPKLFQEIVPPLESGGLIVR